MYKILELNRKEGSILIDWGDGLTLNHAIPEILIGNRFATKGEVDEVIEKMRPADSSSLTIPVVMEQMINSE